MKKNIWIFVFAFIALIVAFFIFCDVCGIKANEGARKTYFTNTQIPDGWKIFKKSTTKALTFRIFSKNYFAAAIIIHKQISIDEQNLRNMANALKVYGLNLSDCKMYFTKKIGNGQTCVRFLRVKTNGFNQITDIVVKKLKNSSVAFIYNKGGMYLKSESAESEPIDSNAIEFVRTMNNEVLDK